MSFIIDQVYKRSLEKLKRQQKTCLKQGNSHERGQSFKALFWWHMQKFIIQNSFSAQTIHTQHQIIIKLLQLTYPNNISASFTMKVSSQIGKSMVEVDLLTKSSEFCTINNKNRRLLITKELLNHLFRARNIFITPRLNINNGRLSINIPFCLLFNEKILRQNDYHQFKACFYRILNLIVNQVGGAVEYLVKLVQTDSISSLKGEVESSRISILNKYVQLLTLKKELSLKTVELPQSKFKQDKMEQFQSLARIKGSLISFQCVEFKSIALFFTNSSNAYSLNFKKEIISKEQDSYFSNTINANVEDNSNNMINIVQATIVIKDPERIRLHRFRQSSNIFVADACFWYICSGIVGNNGNLQNYDDRNVVRKQLLVKKQVSVINSIRYQKSLKHQKQIVRQMKNSHSLFINRYYEASNSPNIFKNDLLMQFLPFPTLIEFTVLNKQSLSFTTKLHFIYFIVQSLRSLSKYSITQMDLKPNNILTYYFNSIRLVDFGESYHPQVCDEKYKPGFTVPYCAPQIFRNCRKFSIKYDVFALGVIISELVFQKYPYFFYKDESLSSLKSKQYLNYWFGCPQETQAFGERKIVTVLWSIINSCLSEDPENRPEINVLAIIMQVCLQILF